MRIAILGAGGVGGYFGGRLADAGEDVSFLARGEHLDALRRNGLRVLSASGDIHLPSVTASDDPARIGDVDLVFFAVKLWDTESAARAAAPLVGRDTAVATFQNGVESVETLSRVLGQERVIAGSAFIFSVIAEPGVIRHTGAMARIVFGEPGGGSSRRCEAFLETCRGAGIDAAIADDVTAVIWEKFILLSALAGVTSVTRMPVGVVREQPETRRLLIAAMEETTALARARNVAVPEDVVARHVALVDDSFRHEMKPSMLQDLERGGRLELPWLNGAVARLGREAGVPTPVHEFIVAALMPHARVPDAS